MGWQSAMVSSEAAGASTRASGRKRSWESARSIARSRSGRSGWPAGVRWSRQAGWVIRSVDIGRSGRPRAIGYSRGVRQRPISSAAGPRGRYSFPSLPGDADAGRWRGLIRHEERRRERLGRVYAIFLEIGDALGREEAIVDEKIAGEAA